MNKIAWTCWKFNYARYWKSYRNKSGYKHVKIFVIGKVETLVQSFGKLVLSENPIKKFLSYLPYGSVKIKSWTKTYYFITTQPKMVEYFLSQYAFVVYLCPEILGIILQILTCLKKIQKYFFSWDNIQYAQRWKQHYWLI